VRRGKGGRRRDVGEAARSATRRTRARGDRHDPQRVQAAAGSGARRVAGGRRRARPPSGRPRPWLGPRRR
jgi:hypothetical protein